MIAKDGVPGIYNWTHPPSLETVSTHTQTTRLKGRILIHVFRLAQSGGNLPIVVRDPITVLPFARQACIARMRSEYALMRTALVCEYQNMKFKLLTDMQLSTTRLPRLSFPQAAALKLFFVLQAVRQTSSVP